jgi:hypothetical protein
LAARLRRSTIDREADRPRSICWHGAAAEARGYAEVSGEKGYIEIDARFRKLQPATRFGSEYLTYVLWAITPEGRAKNLGEVQVDDDDARVQVTTSSRRSR